MNCLLCLFGAEVASLVCEFLLPMLCSHLHNQLEMFKPRGRPQSQTLTV